MDTILNINEKSSADNFCEFAKNLTPTEQEKMESFIQAFVFWKQLEPQLQPTGT